MRRRVGLMAAALAGLWASGAAAELTTEQRASILVFPRVLAVAGETDTIIQITNVTNSLVRAHCFYVNAAPSNPDDPTSTPLWTEIDFDIVLTRQQPTYWRVSEGRLVNPADEVCDANNDDCPNAGIDPGRVPPVVEDFVGELKCVQTDLSGAPLPGNSLKGEAEIIDLTNDDVAKYNAIGVFGLETNDQDNVLCLGGEPSDECSNGAEYESCPRTWLLTHLADGAESPTLRNRCDEGSCTLSDEDCSVDSDCAASSVDTRITVVPCEQNFETQVPETVTLNFDIHNEFEERFSASTVVTCWADLDLGDIDLVFTRGALGTDYVQSRIRPSNLTDSGFMVVATEEHHAPAEVEEVVSSQRGNMNGGPRAIASFNVHAEGEGPSPDLITIPADQLLP